MTVYHVYFATMQEEREVSTGLVLREIHPRDYEHYQKSGFPRYYDYTKEEITAFIQKFMIPRQKTVVNDWRLLQMNLETHNDYYIFIITQAQWDGWEQISNKYGLQKYSFFTMPYFVSNRRYPYDGRKLRLVILRGKSPKKAPILEKEQNGTEAGV